jgi:hypothetical protein
VALVISFKRVVFLKCRMEPCEVLGSPLALGRKKKNRKSRFGSSVHVGSLASILSCDLSLLL